jgi:hypothetical protein
LREINKSILSFSIVVNSYRVQVYSVSGSIPGTCWHNVFELLATHNGIEGKAAEETSAGL